jgi:hypothetical protein
MSAAELRIDFWGKVVAACALGFAAAVGFGAGPYIPLPF